ncbi:MAG: DUF2807 domain-containing protein [Chitinophagaceae bacterium]|nr:MAG: DUF2807 domain-containing protein [Chitinophagaceae bacterium]
MKNLLLVVLSICLLQSCEQKTGSGNIETQGRSVGSFSAVSVGGSFKVEIRQGAANKVTVQADDNILEDIETTVSSRKLRIEYRDNVSVSNADVKITVETPELSSVSASASADVNLLNVWTSTKKMNFTASSSASIEGEADAPAIDLEASSSGRITLKGRTRLLDTQASSAGSIEAGGLLSETAGAQASSGASISVHASIKLTAQASSGGSVNYRGNATLSRQESSGGSINKVD